jgi:hypothetical protein
MNNNKKGDDFVQGIKKIIGAFLILVSIFYVLSPRCFARFHTSYWVWR